MGRRGRQPDQEHARHRRGRASRTPTSPTLRTEVNARTIQAAFRTGLAVRLPGCVQLPGRALRHRCRLERRRLLEPRVRRARQAGLRLPPRSRRPTSTSSRRRRSCSRTSRRSRCGTASVNAGYSTVVENVAVRLGQLADALRRSPRPRVASQDTVLTAVGRCGPHRPTVPCAVHARLRDSSSSHDLHTSSGDSCRRIPVFLGSTFLIFAMVFALPGRPDPRPLRRQDARPDAQSQPSRRSSTSTSRSSSRYFIYLGDLLQGDLGTTFSRPVGQRDPRAHLPDHAAAGAARHRDPARLRRDRRPHRRSAQGRRLRPRSTLLVASCSSRCRSSCSAFVAQYFLGIQLDWFRPTVGPGRSMARPVLPAIVLAALNFAYVRAPDPRLGHRDPPAGLRADGVRQGPPDAVG